MRQLVMRLLIGGLILTGAAACGTATSSTASAPPATNVTGRWAGTYVFDPASAGSGTATLNLTQSGNKVTGDIALQGPRFNPLFVDGIMSGNDIRLTGPKASGWMKVNGNEMTGLINAVLPARVTLRKVQ